MSFNIVLQTSNSERNKLDKTITDIATLSGVLKQETSIIDPVFIIEGDISQYINCNYCTISTFGRSYFINNIRSIKQNLFEISCHVDVLSSFKTQIRNNTAILKRSEANWNLYLNDGSLQVAQDSEVITSIFTAGNQFGATWSYVLIIAG